MPDAFRRLIRIRRKHNDIRYVLGGVTVLKRAAKRIGNGARFTYRLFSKIPVWRREDHTVSVSGPFDVPRSFRPQEVDTAPLLAALRELEPFTFVPNPGNAGDALIAAAALQFFDRHGLRYRLFSGDYSGNVVLNGGGGFVALYPKFVRKVLRETRASARVLVLPSTFRGVDGFLDALDGRFTLFARDRESHARLLRSGTRARVLLGHDMALCLSDDLFSRTVEVSVLEKELEDRLDAALSGMRDVLTVVRTDGESSDRWTGGIDLSKCCYLDERSSPDWIFFGARLFLRAIDRFETVVTDRLHVGIGAILLGKRLILRDDRYHKIRDVYDAEFGSLGNVRFAG